MRDLVRTEQARHTIMAALERGSKGSVSVYELGMSIPADVDLLEYIKSILGTVPILSTPSRCCFYPWRNTWANIELCAWWAYMQGTKCRLWWRSFINMVPH
jgi:hypothetical protein